MNIEWKTGRPESSGRYIVVINTTSGLVMDLPFTVEHGWNTSASGGNEHAFPDEDIVAWTEHFGKAVLDMYGGER